MATSTASVRRINSVTELSPSPSRADVERFLVNCPAVGLENRTDRIPGKYLRVPRTNQRIRFLDEANNRVGATSTSIILVAAKIRSSQPRLAAEHIDTVAAESLLDSLAIE